jgi:TRAP-type mannitol/chloroaromatic compound transport system permease small subunit
MDDLVELPDKKPVGIPEGEVPRALLKTVRFIDYWIGEWSGRIFAWLVIPMVGGLAYEVFARYLFNAPTIWAYEVTYMLYGSHFMLGAAHTLYKGKHIRTDILYQMYSVRWQGIVDAALYLLFFFPGMAFFLWAGYNEAAHSWALGERSDASAWRPILYPFMTVMPVTAGLLLLQGVSEFLKSVDCAVRGRWL